MTTVAPASPKACAISKPNPREPPVTTTTSPLKSKLTIPIEASSVFILSIGIIFQLRSVLLWHCTRKTGQEQGKQQGVKPPQNDHFINILTHTTHNESLTDSPHTT